MPLPVDDCFAATAPGLEPLAAAELHALGIEGRAEPGGVAFAGDADALARANLWLRTASRVIVRAGDFRARAFGELERRAAKVPWERWLSPGAPVRFRVTCKKSRLYHTDAVAERVAGAVAARLGRDPGRVELAAADDDDDAPAAPLVIVRFAHDVCTLSVDSSGELLHRRGYRLATAKAPLRETLAAATLLAAGWHGQAPLADPMCGSGTIVIEGALIARRLAPGLRPDGSTRRFAFLDWPAFDRARWAHVVAAAREAALPRSPVPILGADRDAGAVAAADANAERAGVREDLTLQEAPLSALEPPAGVGWLVTNPPYGVRVGEVDRLRDLYAAVGRVARERLGGWTVALLSAEPRLEAQVGVRFEAVLKTKNGGIPVRVVRGTVA